MENLHLLIALAIHLGWSTTSQLLNRDLRKMSLFSQLLVPLGTTLVALLTLSLTENLTESVVIAWATSFVAAFLARDALLVWRSPRHLVLWRLALNNIVRRKRNSAIMAIGLIVGAAVISSSLVIGDSLDATIKESVYLSADMKDIAISGFDLSTGQVTELNESRMKQMGVDLASDPNTSSLVDGYNVGRISSLSLLNEAVGVGEPRVYWHAYDAGLDSSGQWSRLGGSSGISFSDIATEEAVSGENIIVINRALADDLQVSQGEELRLSWLVSNPDGTTSTRTERLDVWRIVEMAGSAAPAGINGGCIFTTLVTAQEFQEKGGQVNIVIISARGGVEDSLEAESSLFPFIEGILDRILVGDDAGYIVQSDSDSSSISIARSKGPARLSVEEVEHLRNVSATIENSSIIELIQAPVLMIKIGSKNVSGLQSNEIRDIYYDEDGMWYLSTSGITYESRAFGSMSSWTATADGLTSRMVSTGDGGMLIAHDGGVYRAHPDADIPSYDHNITLDSEDIILDVALNSDLAWALERGEDDGWTIWRGNATSEEPWLALDLSLAGAPAEIIDGTLIHDGNGLVVHLEALLSHKIWYVPDDGSPVEEYPVQDVEPILLLGQAWLNHGDELTLLRSGISAHSLGLPLGDTLTTGGQGVLLRPISADGSAADHLEAWRWNGTLFTSTSIAVPQNCDGYALHLVGDNFSCSAESGVLFDFEGQPSGRLPLLMEIEGTGSLPLLLLAIQADDLSFLPHIAPGEVMLSGWAADGLRLDGPTNLTMVGLLQAVNGDFDGETLYYSGISANLPSLSGLEEVQAVALGLVNLSDAAELAVMEIDERSLVMLAGGNLSNPAELDELEAQLNLWVDELSNTTTAQLHINRIKHDGLQSAQEASDGLASTFIVFGSFTIIAGMLLVINIFVMLAEERKSEMGMARALGLQRPDLRSLFIMEGSLVASFASLIGAFLGLGVAWLVALAFSSVFSSVDSTFTYAWTWSSVLAGFSFGFLVTWVTLWATALRNSRMNVVAAMRDLPRSSQTGPSWWVLLMIIGMFALSGLSLLTYFTVDKEGEWAHPLWILWGYFVVLSIGPALGYVLPHMLRNHPKSVGWRRHSARNALTITGLGILIWTLLPGWLDPVRDGLETSEYSFIISGLFSVTAGVMLLTSIAPMAVRALGRSAFLTKRFGPVIPTALAYPLATPFRTALTLGMFSITVFSVVVLAGYSAQFGTFSSGYVDQAQGEFEIVGMGKYTRPLELSDNSSEWSWGEVDESQFDALGKMSLGYIRIETAAMDEDEAPYFYYLRGVDQGFVDHGGLPLYLWDERLANSSADMWQAVIENPNIILVDASFGLDAVGVDGEPLYPIQLSIGDSITLIDTSNPSNTRNVTVVGFLEQGSMWSTAGIFTGQDVAADQFHAELTRVYFSVGEDVTLEYRLELATALEVAFLEQGLQVEVIEHQVQEFQRIVFSILDIFQAYLGLGLAVGIAGLGVVTVRSVSERSHQTGILRALGFQRGMVIGGYILELTWVSLMGIINGVIVGIGFHWYLYTKFWRERGEEFSMPWVSISLIIAGAYILVLLATAIPVRRAASILPAEALRDIS